LLCVADFIAFVCIPFSFIIIIIIIFHFVISFFETSGASVSLGRFFRDGVPESQWGIVPGEKVAVEDVDDDTVWIKVWCKHIAIWK
jgi:hypothetical protein